MKSYASCVCVNGKGGIKRGQSSSSTCEEGDQNGPPSQMTDTLFFFSVHHDSPSSQMERPVGRNRTR